MVVLLFAISCVVMSVPIIISKIRRGKPVPMSITMFCMTASVTLIGIAIILSAQNLFDTC